MDGKNKKELWKEEEEEPWKKELGAYAEEQQLDRRAVALADAFP